MMMRGVEKQNSVNENIVFARVFQRATRDALRVSLAAQRLAVGICVSPESIRDFTKRPTICSSSIQPVVSAGGNCWLNPTKCKSGKATSPKSAGEMSKYPGISNRLIMITANQAATTVSENFGLIATNSPPLFDHAQR